MVFHWSLSDSKSPQVSRTRLSILTVLSNAVVWIVSTRPLTSKSSRPFNNPLVTVPSAPITISSSSCSSILFLNRLIILVGREFANGPGDLGSIPSHVIPKTLKMVLDIRYVSRVKWSNPGKGVVLSPTPQCSSYWKGSLPFALDYGCQLYFTYSILAGKIFQYLSDFVNTSYL